MSDWLEIPVSALPAGMTAADAGREEAAWEELRTAADLVVTNAYGATPRHTRARDGGCRDDCIPCGLDRLRRAVDAVNEICDHPF